ncbi:hypothetical protein ACFC1B_07320 [Streptomyces xiamenensis]|uniref:hypothetical protein n=1 Tax=Streptomyces xiamenensis TaxID=408015 RepID=UPI0035E12028
MPRPTVIADIKTLGPHPQRHAIWEIALVRRENPTDPATDTFHWWQQRPSDQEHSRADTSTLEAALYHQRMRVPPDAQAVDVLIQGGPSPIEPQLLNQAVATLLNGVELIGSTPHFDPRFLQARLNGTPWHRETDIATLAGGFLLGLAYAHSRPPAWTSTPDHYSPTHIAVDDWHLPTIASHLGVPPPAPSAAHTGLGNITWARRVIDRITLPPTLYDTTHPPLWTAPIRS